MSCSAAHLYLGLSRSAVLDDQVPEPRPPTHVLTEVFRGLFVNALRCACIHSCRFARHYFPTRPHIHKHPVQSRNAASIILTTHRINSTSHRRVPTFIPLHPQPLRIPDTTCVAPHENYKRKYGYTNSQVCKWFGTKYISLAWRLRQNSTSLCFCACGDTSRHRQTKHK